MVHFWVILEVILYDLTASVHQLHVAKKVTVPKSKLLLSQFYKQFIIPQNAPKGQILTHVLKRLQTIFFCEWLGVNTVIWVLLNSQLGSLFHFHTDWKVIRVVHCGLMDCQKRWWPFESSEGLISLLLIWSHWAGCVLSCLRLKWLQHSGELNY